MVGAIGAAAAVDENIMTVCDVMSISVVCVSAAMVVPLSIDMLSLPVPSALHKPKCTAIACGVLLYVDVHV